MFISDHCPNNVSFTYTSRLLGNNSYIDHFAFNNSLIHEVNEYKVCTNDLFMFDHLPLFCVLNFYLISYTSKTSVTAVITVWGKSL